MNTIKNYGLTNSFIKKAKEYPNYNIARIIAQFKGLYKVASKTGEYLAEVSGKFRHEITDSLLYPSVGDFVMISNENENENALIHCVLERKSTFSRTAVGVSGQSQVVATNIDIVFLCMSLNNNYNLSRMERYLAISYSSGATPIVLLTKSDLCDDLASKQDEILEIAPFTDIITTSIYDDDITDKLLKFIKPNITASFIGSSGVGKSTIINKLLGSEEITTSEIGKMDKGRHTTTGREMFVLENGGIVIDTPGMREIGVETADLSKSFSDIDELTKNCRFSNCTHTNEPGCAVLEALNNGQIDERRLNNYFKLKRETKYEGLNSKEIENVKFTEMFKDKGGMKNIRKYIRENDKRKKH